MKRAFTSIIFLATQFFIVFFHIYFSNALLQLFYIKQKSEKILAHLTEQKKDLTTTLHIVKSRSEIKKFAIKDLLLEPVRLEAIKTCKDML